MGGSPGGSRVCAILLCTIEHLATLFGIRPFLVIVIDSDRMECRLPEDKLVDLRPVVSRAILAKKLRLRELQSLLGKLQFACRIIPMGRVFYGCLAMAMAGVSNPSHFVHWLSAARDDLSIWSVFLEQFNRRSVVLESPISNSELQLYTDTSGSVGFRAYLEGFWCAERWPGEWVEKGYCANLLLLELFPILVAIFIWGDGFQNKRVK